MAGTGPFAGTYQTYTTRGIREDLQDVIYDVSPTDTPVLSNAGRQKVQAVNHEWQTDVLAAAVTTNTFPEGFDIITYDTVTPTARVGNRCIVSMKDIVVSSTQDAVRKAGRKSDLQRELVKKGKEIKRDMERMITSVTLNTSAGSSGNARAFAGLLHWVKTNTDMATTGGAANPAWTEGIPVFARTDGTARPFTETILKTVMQKCYTSSSDIPTMLIVGPVNKQRVGTPASFPGLADIRYSVKGDAPTTIIGAVDVYVSDFGNLAIVPNRFQRERDAWFINPEFIDIGYLRPMKVEQLAKTGDAEKRMLVAEWTVIVKNELALGLAADLTTT